MRHHFFKKFTLIITVVLLFSGCSTIIDARKQKNPFMQAYYSGSVILAAQELSEESIDNEGDGDELMWLLEAGTTSFTVGEYQKSLHFFEQSENLIKDFDNRAVLNIRDAGTEVGSALTNANAIPYQGMYLDKVMLNTYKALNYFLINKPHSAQVELRRMRQAQKNVVKKFNDDIRKAQKEINSQSYKNKKESKKLGNKSTSLSFNQLLQNSKINNAYTLSEKKSNVLYASLANPFVSYFSALGYLMENNYAEALVDFRNLYKMNPNNQLIQRDYVSVARQIGGKVPQALANIPAYEYSLNKRVIYFVFFNGRAPALKQEKFNIIFPYVGYTGIAFPRYEYFTPSLQGLNLAYVYNAKNKVSRTEEIADFDAIMAQEYHKKFPAMITRLVISTLAKELASYAVVQAASQAGGGYGQLGALVATGAYKFMFNTADTRGWETLPKEVQIAHIPIPDDGIVNISPISARQNQNIKIAIKKETNIAIVFVRGLSAKKLIYKLIET